MQKVVSIGLVLVIIVGSVYALTNFREEQRGAILYEDFFSPQPLAGYTTQRSLTPGPVSAEASLLRQGIAYHQAEEYQLALVAFRAYLEGNPTDAPASAFLLAATAAMATGRYTEGEELLAAAPPGDQEFQLAADWYRAMLAIRAEDFAQAEQWFQQLAAREGSTKYPVEELLKGMRKK